MLVEDNSQSPDIFTPASGFIYIRLLAQVCRQALSLPAEVLWERLDFRSQHRVTWATHDELGSFIRASEYGTRLPTVTAGQLNLFKIKPLGTTVRASSQVPVAYTGGLGSGSASRPALRSRPMPVSHVAVAHDSQVARIHRDWRPPEVSAWDGLFTDDSIRAHADGVLLFHGVAPRAEARPMRGFLCPAA